MASLPEWIAAMRTWAILAHLNNPLAGAAAMAASAIFTAALIVRLFG